MTGEVPRLPPADPALVQAIDAALAGQPAPARLAAMLTAASLTIARHWQPVAQPAMHHLAVARIGGEVALVQAAPKGRA
jgi:hypothetical protein